MSTNESRNDYEYLKGKMHKLLKLKCPIHLKSPSVEIKDNKLYYTACCDKLTFICRDSLIES